MEEKRGFLMNPADVDLHLFLKEGTRIHAYNFEKVMHAVNTAFIFSLGTIFIPFPDSQLSFYLDFSHYDSLILQNAKL